jgi:hypothetical protein
LWIFVEKAQLVGEGSGRFFNHHGQPRNNFAALIPTFPETTMTVTVASRLETPMSATVTTHLDPAMTVKVTALLESSMTLPVDTMITRVTVGHPHRSNTATTHRSDAATMKVTSRFNDDRDHRRVVTTFGTGTTTMIVIMTVILAETNIVNVWIHQSPTIARRKVYLTGELHRHHIHRLHSTFLIIKISLYTYVLHIPLTFQQK